MSRFGYGHFNQVFQGKINGIFKQILHDEIDCTENLKDQIRSMKELAEIIQHYAEA